VNLGPFREEEDAIVGYWRFAWEEGEEGKQDEANAAGVEDADGAARYVAEDASVYKDHHVALFSPAGQKSDGGGMGGAYKVRAMCTPCSSAFV
jgi:hypothetical protein